MYIRNLLVPIIFMTIALYSPFVKAHEGYPMICCHDSDCKKVACSDMNVTKDGWEYQGHKFTKDQIKNFGMPGCHVCINPSLGPLCIQPPFGT